MGLKDKLEQREDERQENEALKSAKETAKKESKKKNPIQKIIWNAVKTAVIPVLLLLVKILLGTILVCVLLSWLTISITGSGDDEEQEEILDIDETAYSGENYRVNTVNPAFLDKETLRRVINDSYLKSEAKANLSRDDTLNAIINVALSYNIDPIFVIAVAQVESNCGTNWGRIAPETNNIFSIRGSYNGGKYIDSEGKDWKRYPSYAESVLDFGALITGQTYFGAGRYDVSSIAEKYCPPGERWANQVKSAMNNIYSSSGYNLQPLQQNTNTPNGGNL